MFSTLLFAAALAGEPTQAALDLAEAKIDQYGKAHAESAMVVTPGHSGPTFSCAKDLEIIQCLVGHCSTAPFVPNVDVPHEWSNWDDLTNAEKACILDAFELYLRNLVKIADDVVGSAIDNCIVDYNPATEIVYFDQDCACANLDSLLWQEYQNYLTDVNACVNVVNP